MTGRWLATPILIAILCSACVSTPSRTSTASDAVQSVAQKEERALMVAIRVEPTTLATRPLQTAGVGRDLPIRMFNAQMAMLDNQGVARPYLIEAVPQLNTDSWRLLPDGG